MRTNKSVGLYAKILFKESPPPFNILNAMRKIRNSHTQKQKTEQNTQKNPYRVMAREEMTLTRKTTIVLYQTSAIKKKPQTVVYWVLRYIWRIWARLV